ncbi:MAG: IgGFc-binding protein, partial [Myxococcota bacterium]
MMSMDMTSARRLSISALFLSLSFIGCSDNNPAQPPPHAGASADMGEPDMPGVLGDVCVPGVPECKDAFTRLLCNADGTTQTESPCPGALFCDPGTGVCTEQLCNPGEFEACTPDGKQRLCNLAGTALVEDACPNGSMCQGTQCAQTECTPGGVRCVDRRAVETCNSAGSWSPSQQCISGTECFDGVCEELCELNKKVSSNIGCEYWSVDLPNYDDAISQPHAIVVTNPNEELTARVNIYVGHSERRLTVGADGEDFDLAVPPGEARVYSVPTGYDHSGTRVLSERALRITSSIPVIAHQFNPLNNVDVYSNDGTLLIPTNAIGTTYWGLSWTHRAGRARIRGYITIVNSSDTPNRVTVRPPARVGAGPGIPIMEAGEERVFELGPGDSLNLSTDGAEYERAQVDGCLQQTEGARTKTSPCPDLTGTYIESEQPVTVFGGHQCGNVLLGVDRCDHMESVLFPVSAWGKSYVGAKFFPRASTSLPEPDVWRVIAAADDTRITTDPPIDGIHNAVMKAGEWRQFEATTSFELDADQPVMMVQYMVGSNWLGIPRICDMGIDARNPTGIGDPAMALAVPTDQYRRDYFVLAPSAYSDDYINVVAPKGAAVFLDDQEIS